MLMLFSAADADDDADDADDDADDDAAAAGDDDDDDMMVMMIMLMLLLMVMIMLMMLLLCLPCIAVHATRCAGLRDAPRGEGNGRPVSAFRGGVPQRRGRSGVGGGRPESPRGPAPAKAQVPQGEAGAFLLIQRSFRACFAGLAVETCLFEGTL